MNSTITKFSITWADSRADLPKIEKQFKFKHCTWKDGPQLEDDLKYMSMVESSFIEVTYYNPSHDIQLYNPKIYRVGKRLPIADIMNAEFKKLFEGAFLEYNQVTIYKRLETSKHDFDNDLVMEVKFIEKEVRFKRAKKWRLGNGEQ